MAKKLATLAALAALTASATSCATIDQRIMDAAQTLRDRVCKEPEDVRQLVRNRLLQLGIDTSKMCDRIT